MEILICDPIAQKGIEAFQQRPEFKVTVLPKPPTEEELIPMMSNVVAMAVRSETKVTAKVIAAAPNLKIVGRAGVGVDNIDQDAATERGIVVVNTPSGNTISTAELTFAMLAALARNIPQANASMSAGKWDRKKFKGSEIFGKTLGILGMGRIGGELAKRANAFGMTVLAYDPYLSHARAKELSVEVVENLDDLLPRVDYITVHMPLTDETSGMLNKDAFAKMKKGACILNCARGGIVVESDLVESIEAGHIGGAALDVYESEPLAEDSPLRKCDKIIMTPHLGASTVEAQENVGVEVAETITNFLLNNEVANAVNMPSLDAKTFSQVEPYLALGKRLGSLLAQVSPKRKDKVIITFGGRAAEVPTDPITRAVLQGFLECAGGKEVNQVNVRALAKSLGLVIEEIKSDEETDFYEWMHVAVISGEERISAGGTCIGRKHEPRIVRFQSQPVEIIPEGVLLILNNVDRPGIVGHVGTLLSKAKINIANMSLGRDKVGGQALTILNLDSVPSEDFLAELGKDPDISNVRVVRL